MGGGGVNCFWFQLFIALSLTTIVRAGPALRQGLHFRNSPQVPTNSGPALTIVRPKDDCVYTAYIKTGSIITGGTDSIISLALYDKDGRGIRISNLETWGGLMGPNHDYFEIGNLDIFSGKGPCLNGPVCSMNLTSDGSGQFQGWYCNYVDITTTGPHKPCFQEHFTVEQWLSTNTSPYELTAIRYNCGWDGSKALDHADRVRVIDGGDVPVVSASMDNGGDVPVVSASM